MNYTIKLATKGCAKLFLEKTGNMYEVSDYNTLSNKISLREYFERFDDALTRFLAICDEAKMTWEDIEHDPSDFCFD